MRCFHIHILFLSLWNNAPGQFRNVTLDCFLVPQISIRAAHTVGNVANTHVVLGAAVVASVELLASRTVRDVTNRCRFWDHRRCCCCRWRIRDLFRCFLLIVVTFACALRLRWVLALIVEEVPVDARCTLVLIWNSVGADVILFTIPRVGDEVKRIIAIASDRSFGCYL